MWCKDMLPLVIDKNTHQQEKNHPNYQDHTGLLFR
jgi:hypothetical protein